MTGQLILFGLLALSSAFLLEGWWSLFRQSLSDRRELESPPRLWRDFYVTFRTFQLLSCSGLLTIGVIRTGFLLHGLGVPHGLWTSGTNAGWTAVVGAQAGFIWTGTIRLASKRRWYLFLTLALAWTIFAVWHV